MAETYKVITKVWIAPGCIVCDACENDCPEVFDVQEQTCVIRPPALSADYLKPLTPSVIVAAEGCPVEVIKYETVEVEGVAPWAGVPAGGAAVATEAVGTAGTEVRAHAPAAKVVPQGPPDPRTQLLLETSKISPSLSAGLGTTVRKSSEVASAEQIVREVKLPRNAPLDQRMAMLAVGGAYQPSVSLSDRLRNRFAKTGATTRREFNFALLVGWGMLAAAGATFGAMFQDFFGPKVLKEPKSQYRVGTPTDFGNPGVYEQYKPNGIWVVNLLPNENKLVALSTTCTHLGCIPAWLAGDQKFKCPCHGSGYYITGVNFEGPTPRPLERYAIARDPDGYIVVDKSRVYRSELGQWDNPESFIAMG